MKASVACLGALLGSARAAADAGRPPPSPPAITFDSTLDDYAVLQMQPSVAQVYGSTNGTSVTVAVTGSGCPSLSGVKATIFNHTTWTAKVPGAKGGDCTIVATDDQGNTANISHATYGDVWYCGGQSNMALPMAHTFSRNITAEAVLSGKYSNIRLKQISTNMNPAFPWISLHDAVATRLVAEHGKVNSTYLSTFSATCYYFGQSLTEELGADAPPLGLVHTAFGGSMIEQWLTEETVESCKNSSNFTAVGGGEWWESRVLPFSKMTLKGWAWCVLGLPLRTCPFCANLSAYLSSCGSAFLTRVGRAGIRGRTTCTHRSATRSWGRATPA